MARTIKATFEISEDSDLGSLKFTIGRKTVTFDDLTVKERIHTNVISRRRRTNNESK